MNKIITRKSEVNKILKAHGLKSSLIDDICKIIFWGACFSLLVMALTGCSSMQIETEDDKIMALMPTVPQGVKVEFVDKRYFTGLLTGNAGYYCKNSKTIYAIYNACVFEHEIEHSKDYEECRSMGHEFFPARLMECRG